MTHIETLAVHEGQTIDPATGAVTPPISLSTTFERQADGSYPHGYDYTRSGNPNRAALEASVAALEGGSAAAAFASGSVAMMSILQALSPGAHVIAPGDMYFGIQRLLREVFGPWGLAVSFIDMTNLDELRQALQPETRLVIVETPSNPQLKITDIRAVTDLVHASGAVVVVDNTIPTPVLQRPFLQAADLIIHASTKYLGGHSDVLGGIVVAREETPLFEQIRLIQTIGGAVPAPFDCWLTLRGIQTLPVRVRAQSSHAQHVAEFLANHPAIEAVLYPGLPTHEAFETAVRQMAGGGGLLSILVRGDAENAMAVAANVQLFTRATSFGGTHSLIEHRASIEAPGTRTPPNLLRLSIGLEHPADLIADLDQALRKMTSEA
ncbi:MAG: aminotransferase class I/II-fold pyridoxal phosphate-dependent enzyme [Ardenticatenaceae bacterium]|nr:aminotransferase class I/II-fold pyridoxal phosphate-dependent enzyme [Ardenticatenaceae bacterium]